MLPLVLLAACASQRAGGGSAEQTEERIREAVRPWLGAPYRRGGTSPRGTDCSGFTKAVMAELFGVELPRTSRDQARAGVPIAPEDLRPGDLVFFDLRKSKGIDHVGLYTGDGLFVHARPRDGVGFDRLDAPTFRRGYRGARRVIGPAPPTTRADRRRPS